EIGRPYWLMRLAEAHGIMGQPEAGLTVLTEALTLVDTTGERWYQSELYRLKGELLLQQSSDNHIEAENCFHHAIEIARNQQAKPFELRTATSVARPWSTPVHAATMSNFPKRGCVTWCERVRARSRPSVVRLFDQRCLSCSMTIRKHSTGKKAAKTR